MIALLPDDVDDRRLEAAVRPPGHVNPEPATLYDLVVVGAGTAGLVSAAGAAGLGARVAIIERGLFGGDCLNVGCVPSKTLVRAARAVADARAIGRFGGTGGVDAAADFSEVMRRVRRIRADIAPNDSVARFQSLGVDVFLGDARFSGRDAVVVGEHTLRFKRAVIATGGRATVPPIPGLAEAGYLTNETVFSLTELPRRVAVIGAGPIGCELAQALRRLGADVLVLEALPRILAREDPEASAVAARALAEDGVRFALEAKIHGVEAGGSAKRIRYAAGGLEQSTEVDAILVGAGRAPNVERLDLDAAGVRFDPTRGVIVDDHLRTTNPKIFAAGDVCLASKFTHAADFSARIVIQNAFFFGRKRISALTIPRCTYTDPEIAHIGIDAQEAAARGIAIDTYRRPLADVDRAVIEDDPGFVKVHVAKGKDEILGATIVAPRAGDLIGEIAVAMAAGMGLGRLASVIHPYPTEAEAVRQIGDAYNRTRLTPRVKALFRTWFRWMR